MKYNKKLNFDFDFVPNYIQSAGYGFYSVNSTIVHDSTPKYKRPNLLSIEGRVSRLNWWIFELLSLIISGFSVAVIYAFAFSAALGYSSSTIYLLVGLIVMIVLAVFFNIIRILNTVKRLHDINLSGAAALVYFIPVIGYLIILILCGFVESSKGINKYGAPPQ